MQANKDPLDWRKSPDWVRANNKIAAHRFLPVYVNGIRSPAKACDQKGPEKIQATKLIITKSITQYNFINFTGLAGFKISRELEVIPCWSYFSASQA